MRSKLRPALLLALFSGWAGWLPVATAPFARAAEGLIRKSAETGYIVTAKPGVSTRVIRRAFKPFKITELRALGNGAFLVRFAKDPGLPAVETKAKAAPGIQAVQPNFGYKSAAP